MDVSLICSFRLLPLTHPLKGKLYLELFDVTSDLEQKCWGSFGTSSFPCVIFPIHDISLITLWFVVCFMYIAHVLNCNKECNSLRFPEADLRSLTEVNATCRMCLVAVQIHCPIFLPIDQVDQSVAGLSLTTTMTRYTVHIYIPIYGR